MSSTRKLLFQNKDTETSFFTDFGTENFTFRDALSVRLDNLSLDRTDNRPTSLESEFDRYSHHYVLYQQLRPVGTVTVTGVRDGMIDCHEYYPQQLLAQLGHLTDSASHFRIRTHQDCSYQTLRQVIREIWIDRLASGTRLNIVNVTTERLKGYLAIGYQRLPVPVFIHPRLKTESHTMVLVTDPTARSFIQDILQTIDQPLSLQSVLNLVSDPVLA